MIRRWFRPALAVGVVVGTLACDRVPVRRLDEGRVAGTEPSRLSMSALHASGGVPAGWLFSPPPGDAGAGRVLFVDYGCHSCHVVRGERFPPVERRGGEVVVGPELTGTGNHHPAGYFAEAIVNPNAVLVDGPGYAGADGRSVMPDYPDMSLGELADMVAYLQSLKSGGGTHDHPHTTPMTSPVAPASCAPAAAAAYLVQVQTVTTGELRALDEWFAGAGGLRLRQAEGVTSVALYVSRAPTGRILVTVLGFDEEARLHGLVRRLAEPDPSGAYGGLAGPGPRLLYGSPALHEARGVGEGLPPG